VLNSPTIPNDVQVASSPTSVPVDLMEKNYGGSVYVFAVAMRNNPTQAIFTVPGAQTGSVSVIGENRQRTITGGQFQDSFGGYAVHLYQFADGSGSAPAPPTGLTASVQ
ncbi:MAG: hypothetical protein ACREAC_17630, partial [Blastocatellia bacterium]